MKLNTRMGRGLSFLCCAAILVSLLCFPAAAYTPSNSTVKVTAEKLEIRQGPGEEYAKLGCVYNGTVLNVLRAEGGWGYIGSGWIDLDLVKTVAKTSSGSLAVVNGRKGYVTADLLNIRTGPGMNYAVCGVLAENYPVTIHESKDGWGRISDGWICLDFVGTIPVSGSTTVTTPPQNHQENPSAGSSVTVTASLLNIREGAGTGFKKLGTYGYGQVVNLLEVKGNWGKTNRGWICLDYTSRSTASAPSVRPSGSAITTGSVVRVNVDTLWIRDGAGLNYGIVGQLSEGYQVKIHQVEGDWGRVDNGWICLDYVRKV